MIIDLQQLEDVRYRFTELGRAVSDLSSDIQDSVDSVQSSLSKLQNSLSTAVNETTVEEISGASTNISKLIGDYFQSFEKFEGAFEEFDNFGESLKTATEKFEQISSSLEKVTAAAPTEAPVHDALKKEEERKKARKEGTFTKFTKQEISSARGQIRGLLSQLKVPAIGAIAAGSIAWMAYGFQEKDRLRAEAGEAMNIMVAAFDGMSSDMVRKGTRYVANFQEQMQKFFGIAKEEVQAVAKAFVDGGISIEEMLSGLDKSMNKVGKNYISYSLAVDKMYELAGGTTARRMVQYVEDYGKSMGEARDTVERLMFLGQESGLGTQYFVDMVERSGDALKKLGFDIDAVADLAVKMQESFDKIGVPKKFAGRQIALGLEQMASGIANMSEGWQSLVAEKMGYGEGLEGRQRLIESAARVAGGGTDEETKRFIVTTVNTVMSSVGEDEARGRYILERDLGFGFEGARIAKMITDAANAGDDLKAKEVTKQYRQQLNNALQTEAQKQSRFQRNMNQWMKGIADIGQGVLGLVGNFMASLLAFFKSIPAFFSNLFEKNADEKNARIMNSINAFQKDNKKYQNKIIQGFKKLRAAGAAMGEDVMGTSFKNLQRAMEFDPYEHMETRTGAALGTTGKPRFGRSLKFGGMAEPSRGKLVTPPPIPSTVKMIPISRPGIYEAGAPEEKYESLLGKFSAHARRIGEDPWVGGELNIISQGVDEEGNVRVGLVGNCPKCGLKFGEGFDVEEYREATAERGEGEVDIINPNTGRAERLDPTTQAGMSKLSQMSIGAKARRGEKETSPLDPRLGKIVSQIAKRFPGKRVKVFRGATEAGREGAHSKGIAIDIGVEGVESKDLFRFIRSNVAGGGQGFYPEQPFVHVDVRPGKAVWVDRSKSGEPSEGKVIGGAKASEWLNKNIGWEKGSVTEKRYKSESRRPKQSSAAEAEFTPQQSVME